MARQPKESDIFVPVQGLGTFTFGRRTMADEIEIQVQYSQLIQGVQPTEWLSLLATWMSAIKVLLVKAPAGWDIDALDPTEEETYSQLFAVHTALVTKEGSFRLAKRLASKAGGPGAGEDAAVLVSAQVQPAAE